MKRFIVILVLLFAVAAHGVEKTDVQLLQKKVQFLQGKLDLCIGRLMLEYSTNIRSLQQVQPQLQTVDKEKKEAEEDKKVDEGQMP